MHFFVQSINLVCNAVSSQFLPYCAYTSCGLSSCVAGSALSICSIAALASASHCDHARYQAENGGFQQAHLLTVANIKRLQKALGDYEHKVSMPIEELLKVSKVDFGGDGAEVEITEKLF